MFPGKGELWGDLAGPREMVAASHRLVTCVTFSALFVRWLAGVSGVP